LNYCVAKSEPLAHSITMNEKQMISKVMAILGSKTSDAKTKACQKNGKLGGRPRKTPRTFACFNDTCRKKSTCDMYQPYPARENMDYYYYDCDVIDCYRKKK
jgi:hypothetical protein